MRFRHASIAALLSIALSATAFAANDLDPATVSPDEPIAAAALHDAFTADPDAWMGKEVSVVGYYKSSTYSSATDATRIDLKTGPTGETVLSGRIAGEVETPKSMVTEREGVILRGKITTPTFGRVTLEETVIVNRE